MRMEYIICILAFVSELKILPPRPLSSHSLTIYSIASSFALAHCQLVLLANICLWDFALNLYLGLNKAYATSTWYQM